MYFDDLGINPALNKVLARQGITSPFPIQAATLPDAVSGRDVLGRGQTGIGARRWPSAWRCLLRLAERRGQAAQAPRVSSGALHVKWAMQIQDSPRPVNGFG
jgi:Superfamily II DNA and RNA helicases